jgi:hypothetical protein
MYHPSKRCSAQCTRRIGSVSSTCMVNEGGVVHDGFIANDVGGGAGKLEMGAEVAGLIGWYAHIHGQVHAALIRHQVPGSSISCRLGASRVWYEGRQYLRTVLLKGNQYLRTVLLKGNQYLRTVLLKGNQYLRTVLLKGNQYLRTVLLKGNQYLRTVLLKGNQYLRTVLLKGNQYLRTVL